MSIGREPPKSIEAEEYFLSCLFIDAAEEIPRAKDNGVAADWFYVPANRVLFDCAVSLHERGIAVELATIAEELKQTKQLDQVGGYAYLAQITARIPTTAQAPYFIETIRKAYEARELIKTASLAVEAVYAGTGVDEVAEELRRKLKASPKKDSLSARLATRAFNFTSPPAEPVPRFLINGRGISTPGNLTNIIAQAKAGKTALISAMIAAAICAEFERDGQDTLGVTATKLGGKKILHLDTEQSPFDHDLLIRRAMRRAGIEAVTSWLLSYGLAGFCANELRQSLRLLMESAHAAGGIFAVIIDGTADLVNDVNDPEESNGFVAELHGLAIEFQCPIIGVVHENPGQDGGKMRGHLGSQLERKAESNLRLKKTEEVTVVFSEKMRKAPIREAEGPRFKWSDDAGMHVSLASNVTLREAEEIEDLRELAEEVFSGNRLRYAEACQKIETARRVGTKAGEKWFTRMKKQGVIQSVGMGMWEEKAA